MFVQVLVEALGGGYTDLTRAREVKEKYIYIYIFIYYLVIRHVALEGYKYIRRSGNIVCVFMCKVDIDSWPSYYFNGSYYIYIYIYIYIYRHTQRGSSYSICSICIRDNNRISKPRDCK